MSKLEKRLIILAVLFVVVYIGAIVISIKSRIERSDLITRIESPLPSEEEGRLLLAELVAPMAVLFTISICFIIAKKKRGKRYRSLDDPVEKGPEDETPSAPDIDG